MNYDLARRLKNAGFKGILFVCHNDDETHPFCRADRPDCKIRALGEPTLSELIEACPRTLKSDWYDGNCDFQIWSINGKWLAVYHWIDGTCHEVCEDLKETDTPEEAVANLYLALHEKETK